MIFLHSQKSKGVAIIIVAAIVSIFLAIFMLIFSAAIWGSRTGNNANAPDTVLTKGALTCPENLNAEEEGKCLDKYMKSQFPKSPLIGKGSVFISAGQKSNVSPALMVAIGQMESGLGTTGIAVSEGGHNYYGLTAKGGGNAKFSSWDEAINHQAEYLRKNYLDQGLTTIEAIGAKYCPVGAANDPRGTNSQWIPGVTRIYNSIISKCPNLVGTGSIAGGAGSSKIVAVAQSQLGIKEAYDDCNCGDPLRYGGGSSQPWCAYFASWVYKKAGYPMPKIGVARSLYNWFGSNQIQFAKGTQDPQPGDLVYYKPGETGTNSTTGHVGIVESYDRSSKTVHTIEGNASNMVRRVSRPLSYSRLVGFGRWKN